MREKVYVDRLFADYEDSPEIRDFKEEIAGNLKERVRELMSKGLGEEEAFEKASAELGDITAIADDLGKRKRNEAIGQMYMSAKVPLAKKTAAGLTIATGLLLIGAGLAVVNYFVETSDTLLFYIAAVLLGGAFGLYAFSGLSQESVAHYAMKNTRASVYGVAVFVGVTGAMLAITTYMLGDAELPTALGIALATMVPAVCALVFLGATESDRLKPWAKAIYESKTEHEMRYGEEIKVDPRKAARFGVCSGGLWLLAVAIFAFVGLSYSWWYALLVFVIALAVQVMMVSTIFVKSEE
ncbi:MAG: permease prefix domain 1-containing protein [Methanomassiliicoccaceae archaeon]|nr:permease prefix domain 1-containing protein [Methanomassiliicoccaceae archaeon]